MNELQADSSRLETDPSEEPAETIPEVFWIQNLKQLKALADPLRIRVLEGFVDQSRTTKQVASLLGEKTTKLYHHVDALEKAGLIELKETRPNRGTLEKYYRAVARMFRAEPDLLSSGESTKEEWAAMGADLLTAAAEELRSPSPDLKDGQRPMIIQAKVMASQVDVNDLQERLEEVIKTFADEQKEKEESGALEDVEEVTYRLALALYPVDS